MSETQLLLFFVTSLVLIATPGQDMMLVMSRSVAQGSAAGVATAAGVCLGLLGHTLLAAFGLGSLLMASEALFTLLKLVGAAYLVYLGAKLVLTKATLDLQAAPRAPLRQLVMQGALSNLSNPKIVIFYFAYLPQFVSPDIAHPTALLLALGAAYAAMGFLVKGPVGYFAGALSPWLRSRPRVLVGINRTSGAILVALGVRLAFEKKGVKLGLLATLLCLALTAAAADARWMLMARHGECAEIASLKRRIPDLGEIADPAAFVERMRRSGYQVSTSEVPDAKGRAVEVKVPEKGLSLIFVAPELCKRNP